MCISVCIQRSFKDYNEFVEYLSATSKNIRQSFSFSLSFLGMLTHVTNQESNIFRERRRNSQEARWMEGDGKPLEKDTRTRKETTSASYESRMFPFSFRDTQMICTRMQPDSLFPIAVELSETRAIPIAGKRIYILYL